MAGVRRGTGAGGHRREPAPVVALLDDPGLVDEVAMVVAATGRRMIGRKDISAAAEATCGLVVVTDSADPAGPELGAAGEHPGTRVIEVTGDLLSEGACGTALQLPEQSTELAAAIGRCDPVDITVAGAVGGAGTSVFAAALAGAVSTADRDGGGQVVLVNQDPHAGAGHLRLLLGADRDTGSAAEPVTWIGDVGVLDRPDTPGDSELALVTGGVRVPVVRDAGRSPVEPSWDNSGVRVLVVPQSVPAVLAARRNTERHPGTLVVLRERPRSGLTWNQTVSLLGRAPEVNWEDDPFLAVDIDRGDFRTTGHGAGTARSAAARLWEQIR